MEKHRWGGLPILGDHHARRVNEAAVRAYFTNRPAYKDRRLAIGGYVVPTGHADWQWTG